jgi:hypothetical protein
LVGLDLLNGGQRQLGRARIREGIALYLIRFIILALLALLGRDALAQPLDRLFYSPEERAMLDAQRQGAGAPGQTPAGNQVTLNGFVARSAGRTTIWLNQVPQYDGEQPQGIRASIRNSKGVAVRLPDSGRDATLKVGQTLDVASGTVREVYQRAPEAEKPADAKDEPRPPVPAKDEGSK